MEKSNLYESVTEKIVDLLENHKLEWNKPWIYLDDEHSLAQNGVSNNEYNGINQIVLSLTAAAKGYAKNIWMTYNQIKKSGGHVKKGEQSARVLFFDHYYVDGDGTTLDRELIEKMKMTNEDLKAIGARKVGFLRYFAVFNVMQTESLPQEFYRMKFMPPVSEVQKNEKAEELIRSTGAKIEKVIGNRAVYNPVFDNIVLPDLKQFKGSEAYYETALHELGHWTGHPSRLNRNLRNNFGSKEYAFEELVAELTSAFLCAELGFSKSISNNAAYIDSWIHVLQDDKRAIFKAARLAEKAAKFVKEQRAGCEQITENRVRRN